MVATRSRSTRAPRRPGTDTGRVRAPQTEIYGVVPEGAAARPSGFFIILLAEDGQMISHEELQEFVVVSPLRPVEVGDLDWSIGHRMSPVLEG